MTASLTRDTLSTSQRNGTCLIIPSIMLIGLLLEEHDRLPHIIFASLFQNGSLVIYLQVKLCRSGNIENTPDAPIVQQIQKPSYILPLATQPQLNPFGLTHLITYINGWMIKKLTLISPPLLYKVYKHGL